MPDAFFIPSGKGRFDPTPNLPGPWHPGAMHGGPPCALLLHAALEFARGEAAPESPLVSRAVFEFLRPVPVEPVEVRCEMVKPGRRAAMVGVTLLADGEPVMSADVWLTRTEETVVPETGREDPPPEVPLGAIDPEGWSNGYLQAVEWGWVEGQFEEPGPATAWARPRFPLVEGHQTRPEEMVALIVDSGSGISAVANPTELIFLNVDVTIHLVRRPVGDSIWMRSETFLEPNGVGLTTTTIGDRLGRVGVAAQSLFVTPA